MNGIRYISMCLREYWEFEIDKLQKGTDHLSSARRLGQSETTQSKILSNEVC
jgi:hypothetical protein